MAIRFREFRMLQDERLHHGAPVGKRALQDEMVSEVDESGHISDLIGLAFRERAVKLPREARGASELDELALQFAAAL
jgi:hypothetical protein